MQRAALSNSQLPTDNVVIMRCIFDLQMLVGWHFKAVVYARH